MAQTLNLLMNYFTVAIQWIAQIIPKVISSSSRILRKWFYFHLLNAGISWINRGLQGTQDSQGKNLDPCNWSNAEILCKTLIWYLEEPKAKGMKKGNQFFLFGFLELNRLGREWWRSIEEFREDLLNSLARIKHS